VDPYFLPHVPDQFDGILVFADSHYRGPEPGLTRWGPGFDALVAGDKRKWTQAQIEDCTAWKNPPQFYDRLRRVIHPKLSIRECFQRVAFANAFQRQRDLSMRMREVPSKINVPPRHRRPIVVPVDGGDHADFGDTCTLASLRCVAQRGSESAVCSATVVDPQILPRA